MKYIRVCPIISNNRAPQTTVLSCLPWETGGSWKERSAANVLAEKTKKDPECAENGQKVRGREAGWRWWRLRLPSLINVRLLELTALLKYGGTRKKTVSDRANRDCPETDLFKGGRLSVLLLRTDVYDPCHVKTKECICSSELLATFPCHVFIFPLAGLSLRCNILHSKGTDCYSSLPPLDGSEHLCTSTSATRIR